MKTLNKEEIFDIIHSAKENPDILKDISDQGIYNDNNGNTYPCRILSKTPTMKGTYVNIFINNGTIIQYLVVPANTITETSTNK